MRIGAVEFLIVQVFNYVLLVGWLLLILLALLSLRRRRLTNPTQALWVLIIVAVPLLGPLAYWIINPQREPA